MEGGETLPSSCSPLLATFDIGKGDREAAIANFRECIHVISSALGQRSPAEWNRLQRTENAHHSRYLMVHRPAFKTSTLSLATMVAHSILMDGQGLPFLATQIRNLVSRRARPHAHPPAGKSPHKSFRNQGLEKPDICEKLREIKIS